jgi:hypothetical protein
MADDVSVVAGSYTADVATQDVAGKHVQEILLVDETRKQAILPSNTAAAAGEAGIPILAQRVDSTAPLADADGKRSLLQVDANGFLRITLGTALSNSVDSVTAHLAAGSSLAGDVALQGRVGSGLTLHSAISAASTNATTVKSSAATLYGIVCFNLNAAPRYLKLYNKATAPDENDTPVQRYMIPGNAEGRGFVIPIPQGLAFATGLGYRLVTGIADNSTGAVAASEQLVNLLYI